MRSLLTGVCVTIVIGLASYVIGDPSLLYVVSGLLGGVCWLLSGFISNRSNLNLVHRNKRFQLTTTFFLLGLPNIIVAVIAYFLLR